MGVKPDVGRAVRRALSAARIGTYEKAAHPDLGADGALMLYEWNAQVSGALMLPLHVCEVAIRNAVSDGIEGIYGSKWPWSEAFERSLPSAPMGYNPRLNLREERSRHTTPGKIVAELKFVFWQRMFTSRHDERIWNHQLKNVLPHLNTNRPIHDLRSLIYEEMEQIRLLRNRIAHHEPIFRRDLVKDLARIGSLIEYRCPLTAQWMRRSETASQWLVNRPPLL